MAPHDPAKSLFLKRTIHLTSRSPNHFTLLHMSSAVACVPWSLLLFLPAISSLSPFIQHPLHLMNNATMASPLTDDTVNMSIQIDYHKEQHEKNSPTKLCVVILKNRFVYACMGWCICSVCGGGGGCMWKPEDKTHCLPLSLSALFSWGRVSLKLTVSAIGVWSVCPGGPPACLRSPVLGLQAPTVMPSFLCGC